MRIFVFIFIIICLLVFSTKQTLAIVNPFSAPNNKFGVHILFDSELPDAAKLVNANGGDWGYVTIPIQWGDKDLIKWQTFMNTAKRYHVIPILRLATEGDYFNTTVWRKPQLSDIMDFANFLDSLDWPTKDRFIIVYNEVNRADEWGGSVNPAEYAHLLSFAVTVFKSKNPDFFVISAGLDNAAPNYGSLYMNEYDFMRQMDSSVPGIFDQVDGIASHSYPNPGFAQPPDITSTTGTASFRFEEQLANSMSHKKLPIFITETGWSTQVVSDDMAAHYYQQAFSTIWNDPNIIAVTPFLLQGWGGPFQQFSLIGANGSLTEEYQTIYKYPKVHGNPALPVRILAAETHTDNASSFPVIDFSKQNSSGMHFSLTAVTENIFNWLIGH